MTITSEPRQLVLTLTSDGNADADGVSTNTLTATLKDGNSLVPYVDIIFTADNGAFFPDNDDNSVASVPTTSQGIAQIGLACNTAGIITVKAIVSTNSDVFATVSSTFGEGGGTTGDLVAPIVDEAANGRIPADTSSLTLRIPAWTNMAAGDYITYYWQVTSAEGLSNTLTDGFPLIAGDVGRNIVFDLDPELAVGAYNGGSAEARYTVMPAGSSQSEESAHAMWDVGEAKGLPAPVVVEAEEGHINLATVPEIFHVKLKWSRIAVNDQVALFWQGTDTAGNTDSVQEVYSHRLTDNDVVGGEINVDLNTATYLKPYENGSVQLFYSLNRVEGSATERSDTATYQVAPTVTSLTEDFEGNKIGDYISSGQSMKLVTSGATVKNISGAMVSINDLSALDLLRGHVFETSGQQVMEFEFPFSFNHFQVAIAAGHILANSSIIFYDNKNIEVGREEIPESSNPQPFLLKVNLSLSATKARFITNSTTIFIDNIVIDNSVQ